MAVAGILADENLISNNILAAGTFSSEKQILISATNSVVPVSGIKIPGIPF